MKLYFPKLRKYRILYRGLSRGSDTGKVVNLEIVTAAGQVKCGILLAQFAIVSLQDENSGAVALTQHMNQAGNGGIAGAKEGRLIPFQPFLDFITSIFEERLQYHTINMIQSAASSTHQPLDGAAVERGV